MSYGGASISREAQRAKIVGALEYTAEMVANSDVGAVYLPIFLCLEEELAAIEAAETAIERAKRLAKAKLVRA